MQRTQFEADHEAYRETVREFLAREIEPNYERWEQERLISRSAWLAAGKFGILGLGISEEFGGAGVTDFRFRQVVFEEVARQAPPRSERGSTLRTTLSSRTSRTSAPTSRSARWLPGLAAGELIGAIAMTEPGAGCDLQGIRTTRVRDGDEWVINGQKTFITNGIHADVVIVVCRTDPEAGSQGFSLIVVERDTPGLRARAQAGQGRAARPGHRRAVLRGRPGAGREPARRRRARASST